MQIVIFDFQYRAMIARTFVQESCNKHLRSRIYSTHNPLRAMIKEKWQSQKLSNYFTDFETKICVKNNQMEVWV